MSEGMNGGMKKHLQQIDWGLSLAKLAGFYREIAILFRMRYP